MSERKIPGDSRIESFASLASLYKLKPTRIRLGLERISEALERLGNPQSRYPAVLVAGTNGKGSVTAFCSSILTEAGFKVGSYYSPHIFRINERIRCDGAEISSRELDEAISKVLETCGELNLTYFELFTAAAALHFSRIGVDIAVFEVGLGGRLDATNLVNSCVTVVTGISRDHMDRLGNSELSILREKLGILRRGAPLVARLPKATLDREAAIAAERSKIRYHRVHEETSSRILYLDSERLVIELSTCCRDYGKLESRLMGPVQCGNIATAVRTLEVLFSIPSLRAHFGSSGNSRGRNAMKKLARSCDGCLDCDIVRRGTYEAFIPGRFQTVSRDPLIILDVSHNEESFLAAIDALCRVAPSGKKVIVFGMLAHKEPGRFPATAMKKANAIVLAKLSARGSATADSLAEKFRRAGRSKGVRIIEARGMKHALQLARKEAGSSGSILVMGSHVAVHDAAPLL